MDWIYSHVVGLNSRKEAVNLGQTLMQQGLFRPIAASRRGKPFRDAYELYRFSVDFETGGCDEEEEPTDLFGDKNQVSSDKVQLFIYVFIPFSCNHNISCTNVVG